MVGAFAGDEGGSGELAGVVVVVAGACVEVVDVGGAVCEHDDVVAGEGGGPPVGDHGVAGGDCGGVGVDAAVFVVCGDGVVDVAVAKLGEGGAFPGLVLAPVLGEADGFESFAECAQEPAGVDLGELVGVADEDDFGVGGVAVVEEAGEESGADHSCFVDDEHRVGGEGTVIGLVEVGEKTGDGVAGDPGAGFEFSRRRVPRARCRSRRDRSVAMRRVRRRG